MNRRGFIAGILAACAAPAIVRADSLMRVVPRETMLVITHPSAHPQYWGKSIVEMVREDQQRLNELLGERMRLTREMIAYGVLKEAYASDLAHYEGVRW